MEWITNDGSGRLRAPRRPDAEIPPHALATFQHACEALAHLVKPGERLTCLDWCERIENAYPPHHRRARAIAAIQAAMLDGGAVLLDQGTQIMPMTSLNDYAAAGFRGEPNPHLYSSPAWYAHAIGAHLQATGRTAPRDVRMGRGAAVHVGDCTYRETKGRTFERIK